MGRRAGAGGRAFGAAAVAAAAAAAAAGAGATGVNMLLLGANQEWVNTRAFTTLKSGKGYERQSWAVPGAYDNPAVHFNLQRLGITLHRYPGGSVGNHWDLEKGDVCEESLDCSLHPDCEFLQSIRDAKAACFPDDEFTVGAFYEMVKATGSAAILTLDVSDCEASLESVQEFVRMAQADDITLRVEIGNESYDPNQGPKPGGFHNGAEFVEKTRKYVHALKEVGASVAVPVCPCPFFFNKPCWGGGESYAKWAHWNGNISAAAADGSYPIDGLVAHNYPVDLLSMQQGNWKGASEMSEAYLSMPEATMLNADAQLGTFPAGLTVWISEYNVQYSQLWGNKTGPVADWLRATENSMMHGVHVAAHILSGAAREYVELMNYHTLFEVNPVSQPGFAMLALNDSGALIAPVAQVMGHLSKVFREAFSAAAEVQMLSLLEEERSKIVITALGQGNLPCLQAAAFCFPGGAIVLLLNRCDRVLPLDDLTEAVRAAAGQGNLTFDAGVVYPGSLGEPGVTWANFDDLTGEAPWDLPVPTKRSAGQLPKMDATAFGIFEFRA